MIEDELKKARGNKTKAAEALGISRRNLIRKVQAYGLEEGARTSGAGTAVGEADEAEGVEGAMEESGDGVRSA